MPGEEEYRRPTKDVVKGMFGSSNLAMYVARGMTYLVVLSAVIYGFHMFDHLPLPQHEMVTYIKQTYFSSYMKTFASLLSCRIFCNALFSALLFLV